MDKAVYRCLLIPLLLFLFCFTSCNEEDCLSEYTSFMVINFVDLETSNPSPQAFTDIRIVTNDGNVIQYEGLPESSAIFPLHIDPHADKISYVFFRGDTIEQITLSYNRMARVLSADCPFEVQYRDIKIIEEETIFLDSLRVTKNELTNTETSNVTIYR